MDIQEPKPEDTVGPLRPEGAVPQELAVWGILKLSTEDSETDSVKEQPHSHTRRKIKNSPLFWFFLFVKKVWCYNRKKCCVKIRAPFPCWNYKRRVFIYLSWYYISRDKYSDGLVPRITWVSKVLWKNVFEYSPEIERLSEISGSSKLYNFQRST